MSYIFDSSAIYKAIKDGAVEKLDGNYTLELARYELGNALWKEHMIHGRVNLNELKRLATLVKRTFKILNPLNVECHEEEILTLASRLGLTFYDTAYVHLAMEREIPLITEDRELLNKAKKTIKTLPLEEIR